VYKRDARQLVRAGLSGGKGIPETVAAHPCVFATLTAPSFGPVHARRKRGKTVLPCRPRRDANAAPLPARPRHLLPHPPPRGRPPPRPPMCGDCYDYTAAVLFNAHAGDLWRRFTTYLPRHLARLTGLTQTELREVVRIRYVKVAEYQARGVVHFHAVIRLDAPGEDYQPPAARLHRRDAVRRHRPGRRRRRLTVDPAPAAPRSRSVRPRRPTPGPSGTDRPARHRPGAIRRAVANYIAKYATKTLDAPGLPDRIRSAPRSTSPACAARPTTGQMITTAWQLGGGRPARPLPVPGKWAHMLGYGGHFLTKSRRYSVTFGQLRAARTEHRRASATPPANATPGAGPSMTPSS
jgi:hypothetical protein